MFKPHCPHCANLNRNRDWNYRLPTNHYLRKTRDPSSDVVCPELAKTVCENCGKPGHTRSYCFNKEKLIMSPSPIKEVLVQKPNGNRFQDLLLDDISSSDDDEEEEGPPFRPRSPDYPPPDY
jgi:hypothetical protein